MEPTLEQYINEQLSELFGPEAIVLLATSILFLIVYFVLAFYSTKLARKTSLPGSKIIAWSCWFLALVWFPILVISWNSELSDVEALSIFSAVIATIPALTAAYGFRKMVIALLSRH